MKNLTVLVVDDERGPRRLTREVLTAHLAEGQQNVTVSFLEAENGLDAIRKIASLKGGIDLIVSDHVMPVMDGRMLHARLRALQSPLSKRIIIVTASDEPHDDFLRYEVPVVSKFHLREHLPARVDLTLLRD